MSTDGPIEMHYEYRVIEPPADLEARLNELGRDGWCLAASVERDGEERFVLRRKDPHPEVTVDNEDV